MLSDEELDRIDWRVTMQSINCDNENYHVSLSIKEGHDLVSQAREANALRAENAAMLQAGGYEHLRSQVVELERKADALRGNAELIAAERDALRAEVERLRAARSIHAEHIAAHTDAAFDQKDEIERLRSDLAVLMGELHNANVRVQDRDRDIANQRAELRRLNMKVAGLTRNGNEP